MTAQRYFARLTDCRTGWMVIGPAGFKPEHYRRAAAAREAAAALNGTQGSATRTAFANLSPADRRALYGL